MFPLRRSWLRAGRRAEQHAAERFHRALSSGETLTSDQDINERLAVTRAVAPALHMRQPFRDALEQQMLREFEHAQKDRPAVNGRALDGQQDIVFAVDVVSAELGRVTLVDVEAISDERAQRAVLALVGLLAAEQQRQQRRR